jgi:hypothetical protein
MSYDMLVGVSYLLRYHGSYYFECGIPRRASNVRGVVTIWQRA